MRAGKSGGWMEGREGRVVGCGFSFTCLVPFLILSAVSDSELVGPLSLSRYSIMCKRAHSKGRTRGLAAQLTCLHPPSLALDRKEEAGY